MLNTTKKKSEERTERINSKISEFLFNRETFLRNLSTISDIYRQTDGELFLGKQPNPQPIAELRTLEELIERDKKREQDGFPTRIRIGKLMRPENGEKPKVILVPYTFEPKFYHDDSVSAEEPQTGGTGTEQEGEVIGESPAQPQTGEGEGFGKGIGGESSHEISEHAFNLGKILTQQFQLPNIKPKGKKPSFTKFQYDLTDINRGFGQILDKKSTLESILKTNLLLGRLDLQMTVDPSEFLILPNDHIYRILSKEKDFEAQALVFFIRDYSGSMQGEPTEVVVQQHLFIYSWLMYQYENNVHTRFIVHDTTAREVPDFFTYYRLQVAGGTRVAPAFQLALKIIEDERLFIENNIYIFYGTDGDDWDEDGRETIDATKLLLRYSNRIGILIARNAWGGSSKSTVENYFERSSLLKQKPELLKIDAVDSESADENRIIQSIKVLVN